LDFEERNEFEISELKKKFATLIDSFFEKFDVDKKGYLNEQEFGKLNHRFTKYSTSPSDLSFCLSNLGQAFASVMEDESLGLKRLCISEKTN